MTATTRRTARYFALPVVAAGIIAGALAAGALASAGAASAGTYSHDMTPGPTETVAPPRVTATPAPERHPHHGIPHLTHVQPDYRQ